MKKNTTETNRSQSEKFDKCCSSELKMCACNVDTVRLVGYLDYLTTVYQLLDY